jgi:hypothetical protein
MRRKVLLDIANTICQMLYSQRLATDRDLLVTLPAGTIQVDLLTGYAHHDTVGQPEVTFGHDFSRWLRIRCAAEDISIALLTTATLQISIDPKLAHSTGILGPFDRWSARCIIATDARTYTGELAELGQLRPMP